MLHTADAVSSFPFVLPLTGRGTPPLLSARFRAPCGISRCLSEERVVCLLTPSLLSLLPLGVAPVACEGLLGLEVEPEGR